MRKKLIAGNWKLNPKSKKEAIDLVSQIKSEVNEKLSKVEVAFCVPAIYLESVKEVLKDSNIKLGAQNCYFEESGAYTGEISATMLNDIGTNYVILGHSERRTIFGETDEVICQKSKVALSNNLTPIVCVGETQEEREAGKTDLVVASQIQNSLKETKLDGDNLVIAYEPVWAIGTGKTCSSEEANRVCKLIRQEIEKLSGKDVASKIIIQYGGSVKASTVAEQMQQSDIDGALVGGASLKADEFSKLLLNAENT
ncbi:MAG: triose-phosphate isomerase [Candidatus Caenarcaniphilales bacterium]|nr:triose-phosphate isomerase [Candidatus Caenarcaniphilales bacterium]